MLNLLATLKAVADPLKGFGQLGLQSFRVFWPMFTDYYEEEAEKVVMGKNYVAIRKKRPGCFGRVRSP